MDFLFDQRRFSQIFRGPRKHVQAAGPGGAARGEETPRERERKRREDYSIDTHTKLPSKSMQREPSHSQLNREQNQTEQQPGGETLGDDAKELRLDR
ncbi:hypothetical protein Y1Q_0017255 [Alligator mississippiensis]|uniref:Uncharacterized protein n=1 Tax=Alligator mississippiensis TaxID=8496 RepID=A0A151NKY0_ALLMI|nr:hypothetical protein Y1Q_0017255 [Alligator mississippiensis]